MTTTRALERSLRLGPAADLRARWRGSTRGDESDRKLLGAILDANLDQRIELAALRDWVRRALRSAKRRDSLEDDRRDALGLPPAGASRFSRVKHTRKLKRGAIHLDD